MCVRALKAVTFETHFVVSEAPDSRRRMLSDAFVEKSHEGQAS